MDNDFTFTPPDLEDDTPGSRSFIPSTADAALTLQLIQLKLNEAELPDDIKKKFLSLMLPYINNASMTQISLGQVREFIGGFDETILRFTIFNLKKKYVPTFNFIVGFTRELLIMNLNKSVGGWQGNHVFEKKQTYDVRQTRKDLSERIQGLLGRKKKTRVVTEEDLE